MFMFMLAWLFFMQPAPASKLAVKKMGREKLKSVTLGNDFKLF